MSGEAHVIDNANDLSEAGPVDCAGSTSMVALQSVLQSTSWTSRNQGNYRAHYSAPILTQEEQELVDRFSDLYYSKIENFTGLHTIVLSWMGYELFKCPLDLWIYQEFITANRPDLIIEVGTYKGGSALYLASICDLVGVGKIVTVDIDTTHDLIRPRHPRISYLAGSSTDPSIIAEIKKRAEGISNVLVILDGDHMRDHVLEELRLYSDLIAPGGLLVVEDTNINGHPTYPDFGPGPWEAVDAFLAENSEFVPDRSFERFLLTMNPRGYLRRISA